MNWMFNVITQRLNALFLQVVATNFETQAATLTAERKAELFKQAEYHRQQGHEQIADELEATANNLSTQQPLASVLPAMQHWQANTKEAPHNKLAEDKTKSTKQISQSSNKKKAVTKKRTPK